MRHRWHDILWTAKNNGLGVDYIGLAIHHDLASKCVIRSLIDRRRFRCQHDMNRNDCVNSSDQLQQVWTYRLNFPGNRA